MGQYVEFEGPLEEHSKRVKEIRAELFEEFGSLLLEGGITTARGKTLITPLSPDELDLPDQIRKQLDVRKVLKTNLAILKQPLDALVDVGNMSSHRGYIFTPGAIAHLAYYQWKGGAVAATIIGADGQLSNPLGADGNFGSSLALRAHHVLTDEGITGSYHRFSDLILRDLSIKFGLGELRGPRAQQAIALRKERFQKTA